ARQYVPLWARMAARIGDDLAVVFSTLRAEGTMRLSNAADRTHLRGRETWNSLVFYWLPLCGSEIGDAGRNLPGCARIDVVVAGDGEGDDTQCGGRPVPRVTVDAS